MRNPHLEQFAHQLKLWAQDIIDHGRSPFRRVDCLAEILTATGPIRPPLIFWINRQSMMAGGIVLLPEKNLADELERGKSCADALGLSHFVTWEADQVRLWRVGNGAPCVEKHFTLPGTDHPEFFRHLLRDLIDALKIPAVTGAVPQDRLSIWYFLNLFNITLELALPSLTDAFRSRRAEGGEDVQADVDERALEATRLLLLQILTALRFGLVPDTLLPERLGDAIAAALQRIPEPLRTGLNFFWEAAPPTLPGDTAVCFNHLLLRLQQLRWAASAERINLSLHSLIARWCPHGPCDQSNNAETILYPRTPATNPDLRLVLSDSPLVLAATTIMRELAGLPTPKLMFNSLISLTPEELGQGRVQARLMDPGNIARNDRALFGARLRTSWPHRHFKILTDQPRWKWELIHLLGLCQPQQQLQVECPPALLGFGADDPVWTLLGEHYHLHQIVKHDHSLHLVLLRSPMDTAPTLVTNASGHTRELFLPSQPELLVQQLLETLESPARAENTAPPTQKPHLQASKNLKQDIIDQLHAHGIPNFPDQYLYFLDHPAMETYSITPPLTLSSQLLGQFEMVDATGLVVRGYGEELEQSLLICARSGKSTFELPRAREQLDELLHRYRKDLDILYQLLSDLSYRRMENPQAARNLIRSIWKKLELPDPEGLKR